MSVDGYHACPRHGCDRRVPDHLFACFDDWLDLPVDVRRRISATAHLPLTDPERRDAIAAARTAWRTES